MSAPNGRRRLVSVIQVPPANPENESEAEQSVSPAISQREQTPPVEPEVTELPSINDLPSTPIVQNHKDGQAKSTNPVPVINILQPNQNNGMNDDVFQTSLPIVHDNNSVGSKTTTNSNLQIRGGKKRNKNLLFPKNIRKEDLKQLNILNRKMIKSTYKSIQGSIKGMSFLAGISVTPSNLKTQQQFDSNVDLTESADQTFNIWQVSFVYVVCKNLF